MTYRNSFLLTTEDPISFEQQSEVKDEVMEKQLDVKQPVKSTNLLTPQAANTKPTINGACDETERNGLSSVHYLKKEVERLKNSLEQEKRKNSVDLSCE